MNNQIENNVSLTSDSRIQNLINEAENELANLQPEIDYLEGCVVKLNDLKLKKNRLLSLIASLKSILKQQNNISTNINKNQKDVNTYTEINLNPDSTKDKLADFNSSFALNSFVPELALDSVSKFLRTKNNLNYEIFKAVVYNAGEATTEEIKEYLVKNKIRQPQTGKYFDNVELKDISSRANYLVRKKLLISVGPGTFRSTLGYTNNN